MSLLAIFLMVVSGGTLVLCYLYAKLLREKNTVEKLLSLTNEKLEHLQIHFE